MENQEEKIEECDSYLESPKAFHLEMPLYHPYDLSKALIKEKIYELMTFSGTIDAYCIECEKESVFESSSSSRWVFDQSYYFSPEGSSNFQKIGQFPSVADFQIPQAKKYRKILGENQYKELTRGIGVAAHGVGIGSFVYLRRIFENLIDEAHVKSQAEDEKFSNEEYLAARMDDKIKMVKNYLPEFLVENRSLYAILSKGIHDLSEDECLKYFDTVKIGIEQILDEKIIQKERVEKAMKAREAIKKAHGKLTDSK